MKQLILLRHAKSISLLNEMSDFKRTLNDKGRKDAPKVALAFDDLKIVPDTILCSNAYRTKETIQLFMETLKWKTIPVVYTDELYHASASGIYNLVAKYPEYNNIMVVGHNFGISDLANHLSDNGASEMNTCGLYVLRFKDGIEWNKGEILTYISPKNI